MYEDVVDLENVTVGCRVLVSSCNRRGALYSLSADLGNCEQLMAGNVRGFDLDGDDIIVAKGEQIGCGNLGRGEFRWSLPDSRNRYQYHDVIVHGNLVYVVMTAWNQIAMLDRKSLCLVGLLDVGGYRYDCQHLNSLCPLPAGMAVSMFTLQGKMSGKPWPDKDGAILVVPWDAVRPHNRFALADGAVLASGLDQPHSLLWYGDWLYFTESRGRRLCRLNSSGGDVEIIYEFGSGFIRGLAAIGDTMYVGSSSLFYHPKATPDFKSGARVAQIYIFDLAAQQPVRRVDITTSVEVYEIRLMI